MTSHRHVLVIVCTVASQLVGLLAFSNVVLRFSYFMLDGLLAHIAAAALLALEYAFVQRLAPSWLKPWTSGTFLVFVGVMITYQYFRYPSEEMWAFANLANAALPVWSNCLLLPVADVAGHRLRKLREKETGVGPAR